MAQLSLTSNARQRRPASVDVICSLSPLTRNRRTFGRGHLYHSTHSRGRSRYFHTVSANGALFLLVLNPENRTSVGGESQGPRAFCWLAKEWRRYGVGRKPTDTYISKWSLLGVYIYCLQQIPLDSQKMCGLTPTEVYSTWNVSLPPCLYIHSIWKTAFIFSCGENSRFLYYLISAPHLMDGSVCL